MRKLMVAIGCCMVCLIFMGCPSPEGYFWFRVDNKSSQRISLAIRNSLYSYTQSDTSTLHLIDDPIYVLHVYPNSQLFYHNKDKKFPDHYTRIPSGIMPIYIFSIDTINKYTWQETLASGRVLQRYDLSYKDIESLGFVIPYPPTEAMRDMKMWPRYKSVVE